MWRDVILDVLHHYKGAFTWDQLWEDVPGSEIKEIRERASAQAHADQTIAVFQAYILAKNPYVGGMKELEADTLYTGLAALHAYKPPHPERAMRGMAVAFRLGLVRQPHVDLLGNAVIAWLRKHERF